MSKDVENEVCEDVVLKAIREKVKKLTVVDYKVLSDEMKKMQVNLPATFTHASIDSVNDIISKIQGYRNRMLEISLISIYDKSYRKRYYEMALEHILSTNDEIAEKKSDKLRTASANIIIRDLEEAMFRSELFAEMAEKVEENLKIVNDNVSRQLSAVQTQVALGEIRRKSPGV